MAVTYKDNVALFTEGVSVEEAEGLLEWLQQHPTGAADFSGCTHLHAAVLQVLMAGAIAVAAWPEDHLFKSWLAAALAN